jgi:hypothetical protein
MQVAWGAGDFDCNAGEGMIHATREQGAGRTRDCWNAARVLCVQLFLAWGQGGSVCPIPKN